MSTSPSHCQHCFSIYMKIIIHRDMYIYTQTELFFWRKGVFPLINSITHNSVSCTCTYSVNTLQHKLRLYYEMQLCKYLHLPGTLQMYCVLFSLCLSYLHVPLVNEHSDCFSIILSLSRALIPGQWIYTVHMCTVLGK